MTDHAEQGRPLTPRELRAVVHRIAWLYLEVERGLRPYQQLETFLTPGEYQRHSVTNSHLGVEGHGPVRPHDIARVHLARSTPERVDADVLVRRGDDGWSTLVVDLTQRGQGWQVARLDRLEHVVVREPFELAPPQDPSVRIARVNAELQATTAARDAIGDRIDAIGDRRLRAARELQGDWERWDDRSQALTDEMADLRRQNVLRDVDPEADLDRDTAAVGEDPWLGTRPHDREPALVWDRARAIVVAYRDRWSLDHGDDLLGGCENEAQRQDLRQVLAQICQYETAGHSRDVTHELGLELDLGDAGITHSLD